MSLIETRSPAPLESPESENTEPESQGEFVPQDVAADAPKVPVNVADTNIQIPPDQDPIETSEWIESAEAVLQAEGPDRLRFLLSKLAQWARRRDVQLPFSANTDYVNTIPRHREPPYPGDREIERRIKSYVRWNAMAMVVRANRQYPGIGGHISTFASAATLYEVGFNHFFRGHTDERRGDQIYFQGHASPGIYARAYLEGRLGLEQLKNFRRESAKGGGLSSYPHPWLMPDFWEFPTVSMGLGPLNAIYQARFNRYLHDRGLADTSGQRVWAFLGDGEMDEPEALGAITLAAREQLDNLTFVVNCNLQRLDGPVRGNGNIIQELEAAFRGAGWNVIKVIWGSDWDPLLESDADGLLVARMNETLDGEWQRYTVDHGSYAREKFFGKYPQLAARVAEMTDEQLQKMRIGGHDPNKVHAAFKAATEHCGQPTVILARTIKGYGMGEAGEGKNITHQQKKLNEDELRAFRDRFNIPVSDKQLKDTPFYSLDVTSPEYRYLIERRAALGGSAPRRMVRTQPLEAPTADFFREFNAGSGEKAASSTMVFMRMLARLLADKQIGKLVVPIVPDEARTFGMEALFRTYGIYAHHGQLYDPVDSAMLLSYHEAKNGQILEEGITEAGSMASFTAAGTAYATHGVNTIPFFMFYSMFGFQRIGDSIWACADMRGRGFLIGATAGRTTLAGEGLQHQDGQSQIMAANVPNLVSYDPAYAYELAVIVRDGIRRMYRECESIFYYITVYNEAYVMPPMPADPSAAALGATGKNAAGLPSIEEGILRGLYKFRPAINFIPDSSDRSGKRVPATDGSAQPKPNAASSPAPRAGASGTSARPRIHLFGSGPIVEQALRAQEILAEKFSVDADVWSVTSYNELYRDAVDAERWNTLHPAEPQKTPYITRMLKDEPWPIVAASDYVKALPARLHRWTPAGIYALGTDGFGRSEGREALREFFEISPEYIALAALKELARTGKFDAVKLPAAMKELGMEPDRCNPARS